MSTAETRRTSNLKSFSEISEIHEALKSDLVSTIICFSTCEKFRETSLGYFHVTDEANVFFFRYLFNVYDRDVSKNLEGEKGETLSLIVSRRATGDGGGEGGRFTCVSQNAKSKSRKSRQ